MVNIASLISSVATLVVALAVLYLVLKASKAIDTFMGSINKDK